MLDAKPACKQTFLSDSASGELLSFLAGSGGQEEAPINSNKYSRKNEEKYPHDQNTLVIFDVLLYNRKQVVRIT